MTSRCLPARARRPLATLLLALLLCPAEAAVAWTPSTRKKMAEDAARLVPPSLQRLLKRYRRDLGRGLAVRGAESKVGHFEHPGGEGALIESAAEAMHAALAALQGGEPLRDVVARLGHVAHLVGDLDDPLVTSQSHPQEARFAPEYTRYVESILPKVRLTLERRQPRGIDAYSLKSWAEEAVTWSRQFYDPIGRSFWVDGTLVRAETFDERSIPFGIGSLTYARAVNDIAVAWITLWREGGGDASGALYDRLIEPRPPRATSKPEERTP
jgi:hypothetical protein